SLFQQIRSGGYANLQSHRADAPDRWRDAIASALVVDPTMRVQSVGELSRIWFAGDPPPTVGPFLSAPTGDVTLLFSDVEGSTSLWYHYPNLARQCLLAYETVLREVLLRVGGYEVETEGDSFMIAFSNPELGIQCALEAQRDLARQPWPERLRGLRQGGEQR